MVPRPAHFATWKQQRPMQGVYGALTKCNLRRNIRPTFLQPQQTTNSPGHAARRGERA